MSRPHCVRLRDAYNRLAFKRPLDEALKATLKGQANYLLACQILISDDMSLTPLGSDKEIEHEEIEVGREADRQVAAVMNQYKKEKVIERGEAIFAATKTRKARQAQEALEAAHAAVAAKEGEDAPALMKINMDTGKDLTDEERVMNFAWDGKGRFMDGAKLMATFRELEYVENLATNMLDKLGDEINAILDIYKAILKHRFETEAYIRIYTGHVRCLKDFVDRRGKPAGGSHDSIKREVSSGSVALKKK